MRGKADYRLSISNAIAYHPCFGFAGIGRGTAVAVVGSSLAFFCHSDRTTVRYAPVRTAEVTYILLVCRLGEFSSLILLQQNISNKSQDLYIELRSNISSLS